MAATVVARAPGRVNLIGDHTDYTGGLVLPMAIDRWTEVTGTVVDDFVRLRSDLEREPAIVDLADDREPATIEPPWARYVAGVVSELKPGCGLDGTVHSTVPVGAGLSSSAALEVAVALALGWRGEDRLQLARLCQAAEHRASGVPCGIMDQLASAAGVAGHALLIDCTTMAVTPVALPADVDVVVVHSGEPRALAGSAYAERTRQCRLASDAIGPLADARESDLAAITDPVVRARARHVVTENERVRRFATMIAQDDVTGAGTLMLESHASLRDDYAVSTPALDALVEHLVHLPGVYGARLTGAGFGGCVVALARSGAIPPGTATVPGAGPAWLVRAVDGATVTRDA